nr:hypothetical protein [Tanacetum cinerariifolium]
MELVLEQTQQGSSYEVSVSAEGVEELKRKVKIKGEKKEALLTLKTVLYDILKRIKMKYLPQKYWKNVDKERAGAIIQAIVKQLKNRRIIRSLEKFIGGRPYEGDFQLLERTI